MQLIKEIKACTICKEHLPFPPNPIVSFSKLSKILIIGQAPGMKVEQSGIPWDDKSGDELRKWLQVSKEQFYNPAIFAIVPMGFCYPGKGKSGDLPPRPECAPQWHELIHKALPKIELTLLIGAYSQNYYLKKNAYKTLTETVMNFRTYLPNYFPLPHPSPRNFIWRNKNPWFEMELLPVLKDKISAML